MLAVCVFVGSRPTSHVEVGGGRVAHALRVGGHALVLPLVGLLAVLDLQRSCKAKGEGVCVVVGEEGGREMRSGTEEDVHLRLQEKLRLS